MRNLKRALSLALASVMVASMTLIGAGAVSIDDFTDAEEIVNKEAVTTMVSLGVIDGNDDGSYNPSGVVKRGEMAKLIAVMLNGGNEPTLGEMTASFSDTAGHWAQNYITYVANLHIIDGRGDGSFGPNDDVTGSEAAKMILTALGYRSEIEGFTGANWAINVQLKANDIQLFEGLTINPDEGLTRDDTAQMLYNAVQAQEVEYRNLDGNYNDVIYPTEKGTVLANRFGVVKVEGLVVANDVYGVPGYAAAANGRVRLEDTNTYTTTGSNGQTVERNYNGVYNVDIDNDMVGTRIVLYVKFQNALAPNAANSTVIGTPISSDKNTVAETASRMKDINAVRDFLSDNDLTLANARTADNDEPYIGTLTFTKDDTVENDTVERAFAATGSTKVNGIEFKFIDHDDDGIVDYIFRTEPTMAKVTVYNEADEELTIAGLGSVDFNEVANPEDVAKDDMVLYHKVNETYYLNPVETVSGEVTAYSNADKTLTIDGTAYGQSAIKAEISSTDLELLTIANDSGDDGMEFVGNTYTFYLDAHGNVVAWVLGEESLGSYALVLGADVSATPGFESADVKLLLADGSTGTYDVNLLASANRFGLTGSNATKEGEMAKMLDYIANNTAAGGDTTNGMNNTIVTYSVSGSTVTLGDPAPSGSKTYEDGVGTATQDVDRGTGSYTLAIAGGSKTVKVNDSTLFFIRNVTKNPATGDEYSVVQGVSNLPTSTIMKSDSNGKATVEAAVWTTTNANNLVAKAVFVDGEFKGTANYVYVVDTYTGTEKTDSGERVYTYPVVFENGEKGELNFGSSSVPTEVVLEYTIDSNGVAEYTADVAGDSDDTVNGVVSTYGSRNNLTVVAGDGSSFSGSYTVASDAKIWNVENDPVETTLTRDLSVAFVLDSDGLVKTVFVKDSNVTAFNDLRIASGVNGSFALANSPVYSGYDAVITGGTAGNEIKYVVTYTNGRSDAEKTVTVDASDNATISVAKNTDYITITGYSGATTPTPPASNVDANSPASDVNDALENGNITLNGFFAPADEVVVPAGKTLTIEGEFEPAVMPDVEGTLVVNGNATLPAGNLYGDVSVSDTLTMSGSLYINGNMEVGTLANSTNTVTVTSGAVLDINNAATGTGTIKNNGTVKGYYNIANGGSVVTSAGATLDWEGSSANTLLVGDTGSGANLELSSGTFTYAKDSSTGNVTYTLSGSATVQQADNGAAAGSTEPFVVGENEELVINSGATLTVAAATDEDLGSLKPVLSIHATNGKLTINGTLVLEDGARVVLGNGASSITKNGTITDNTGAYDGSTAAGVDGLLDASHNRVTIP